METIKGLLEAVEQPSDFAASIVARDESLALYAATPGLGPPDLCWLQKAAKGSWTASASEPRGFFHYLLGRDVSSSAAIAAYFAELNSKVEPVGLMQGLWYTAETKIERGFYCCFDPFTRLDVRCELCIPGGVVCGALDADGTVHDVTDQVWRNCVVASFMRHQLYDPELTSHSSLIHRWEPLPGSEAESRLLKAVREMYAGRLLPKALEFITPDVGGGCTAEHMDVVLHVLLHYFGARHRWQAALDFFSSLQQVYLPAAVYVAAVQRELDSFDASFSTLSAAVEAAPSEPCLLLALANECLYAEQTDTAAKLARRAVRLQRSLRPAWLLLARCYIRQGLYALALITLNAVPPPPMPASEQEMLLGVSPPDPKYITKPAQERYDPDLQAARQMSHEEVVADGLRALLYLPAAVMVPREPLDLGPWPDLGPGRITRAVLAAAYGLLQELVAAIGWDSFLEMRARVFVMQSETLPQKKQAAAGAAATTLPASPRAEGEPGTFNEALEELAAIGLSEYPDDVREARAANLLAAHTAREEDAAAAKQLPSETVQPAAAGAADSKGVQDVNDEGSLPSPVADAKPPTIQSSASGTPQHDQEVLPAEEDGDGAMEVEGGEQYAQEIGQEDGGEEAAEQLEEGGEQLEERPSGFAGMLASIPGSAALWGMMFGVTKQPARPALAEHHVRRLQNVKSIPLSRAISKAPSKSPSGQIHLDGPLASIGSRPSQSLPSNLTTTPSGAVSSSLLSSASNTSPPIRSSPASQQQPIAEGFEGSFNTTSLPVPLLHGGSGNPAVNVWQSEHGPVPWPHVALQAHTSPHESTGTQWLGQQCHVSTSTAHVSPGGLQLLRGFRRALKRAACKLGKRSLIQLQGQQQHSSSRKLGGSWRSRQQPVSLLLALQALQAKKRQAAVTLGQLLATRVASRLPEYGPLTCLQRQQQGCQGRLRQLGPTAVCEGLQQGGYGGYDSSEDDGADGEEPQGQQGVPVIQNSSSSRAAGEGGRAVRNGGGSGNQVMRAMLAPSGGSGVGPVSTLDADRDFVLLGAAAMETIEDMQGAKAKRLCVRWLDELIIALWHDLQAYMEWKTLDSELLEVVGNTAAGCVLGMPPRPVGNTQDAGSSAASGSSHAPSTSPHSTTANPLPPTPSNTAATAAAVVAASTPAHAAANAAAAAAPHHPLPSAATILASTASLTAGDWMRRGLLAERLYHDAEALAAYRCCLVVGGGPSAFGAAATAAGGVSTAPPHLLAAQAVMRLAAEAGDERLAAHAAMAVLHWHSTKMRQTSSGGGTPAAPLPCAFPPTPVSCCLAHLNASMGASKLQALLDEVAAAGLGSGFGAEGLSVSEHGHFPGPAPENVKAWAKQVAKQLAARA